MTNRQTILAAVLLAALAVAGHAANHDTNFAYRIDCELQTAGEQSLPTLTWIQGQSPVIEARVLRNGRPVTADTGTVARMLIGPSGSTGTTYAVATNWLAAGTNAATAYWIGWGIVGTNSAPTNSDTAAAWWYTVFFEKDGYRYWTGSGDLYIEKSTATGDELTWLNPTSLASVAWGQITGDPTNNAALTSYIAASAGADSIARAGVASNAASILAVGAVASNAVQTNHTGSVVIDGRMRIGNKASAPATNYLYAASHYVFDETATGRSGGYISGMEMRLTNTTVTEYNSYLSSVAARSVTPITYLAGYANINTWDNTNKLHVYSGFKSYPTISQGIVDYLMNVQVYPFSGTGTVNRQYGVYVYEMTNAVENYAFYAAGSNPSRFGPVELFGLLNTWGYSITNVGSLWATNIYVGATKAAVATGTPLYAETYLGTITGATVAEGSPLAVATNAGVLAFTIPAASAAAATCEEDAYAVPVAETNAVIYSTNPPVLLLAVASSPTHVSFSKVNAAKAASLAFYLAAGTNAVSFDTNNLVSWSATGILTNGGTNLLFLDSPPASSNWHWKLAR